MKRLRFKSDEKNAKANVRKHGVSLEEARTVLYDENAIQFCGPDPSEEEDRFILLGLSFMPPVLVVCHCFRESETICVFFLLEEQTKNEEEEYWKQRK